MSLTFQDLGVGFRVWIGVNVSYFQGPGGGGKCVLLSRTWEGCGAGGNVSYFRGSSSSVTFSSMWSVDPNPKNCNSFHSNCSSIWILSFFMLTIKCWKMAPQNIVKWNLKNKVTEDLQKFKGFSSNRVLSILIHDCMTLTSDFNLSLLIIWDK